MQDACGNTTLKIDIEKPLIKIGNADKVPEDVVMSYGTGVSEQGIDS